jgi:hypothetical protein
MRNARCFLLWLLLVSVSSVGQQTAAPKSGVHDFVSTGAAFLRACDPPDASTEARHNCRSLHSLRLGRFGRSDNAVKSETEWVFILPNAGSG